MLKINAHLFSLAAMAFLLVACGGANQDSNATPTPLAPASQDVAPPPTPAISVVLVASATPADLQPTPALATPVPFVPTPQSTLEDKSVTVVVKPDVEGLRFRVRPGVTGEVATYLSANTRLLAHARSADGVWLRVTLNTSAQGYVMAQFVNGDITQLPIFDAAAPAVIPINTLVAPVTQTTQTMQQQLAGKWFLAWWPFSDVTGKGRPLANVIVNGLSAEMEFKNDGGFATAQSAGRYEILDAQTVRVAYEGDATPYVFQMKQVDDGLLLLGQSREGQGLYRRTAIDFGNQGLLGRWEAQSNFSGVEGLEDLPTRSTIEFNSNGIVVIQRPGLGMQIFQYYWVDDKRLRLIQGSVDNSLVLQVSVSGETMTLAIDGNTWVFKRS